MMLSRRGAHRQSRGLTWELDPGEFRSAAERLAGDRHHHFGRPGEGRVVFVLLGQDAEREFADKVFGLVSAVVMGLFVLTCDRVGQVAGEHQRRDLPVEVALQRVVVVVFVIVLGHAVARDRSARCKVVPRQLGGMSERL